MIGFIVAVGITWRITALLVDESGPFDMFSRLRDAFGVDYDVYSNKVSDNEIGKMLCCFRCTSVWVALLVCLIMVYPVHWSLALSAFAIAINRVIR